MISQWTESRYIYDDLVCRQRVLHAQFSVIPNTFESSLFTFSVTATKSVLSCSQYWQVLAYHYQGMGRRKSSTECTRITDEVSRRSHMNRTRIELQKDDIIRVVTGIIQKQPGLRGKSLETNESVHISSIVCRTQLSIVELLIYHHSYKCSLLSIVDL